MDLRPEEGLRDTNAARQCRRGHEDIDAKSRDIRLPHRLGEPDVRELRGESELAADRLPDARPVERAGERIRDRVRDRAVVLVAGVEAGGGTRLGPGPGPREARGPL